MPTVSLKGSNLSYLATCLIPLDQLLGLLPSHQSDLGSQMASLCTIVALAMAI